MNVFVGGPPALILAAIAPLPEDVPEMMLASLLSAAAGEAQAALLTASLFLLGVGWNFGFVAASAALQEGLILGDRLRLQGLADSVTWISGGVAALASGFVMSTLSFPGLALAAAGVALAPLLALGRAGGDPASAAKPRGEEI